MRFVRNFVCNHLIKAPIQKCVEGLSSNFAETLFRYHSIAPSSLKEIDRAKVGRMSSTCSSPPSSPTQVNSSFTSIDTEAPQSRMESGRFAVGSKRRKSTKAAPEASNVPSQAADVVNVLSQLPEDEATIRADKIHQLAALYTSEPTTGLPLSVGK